MTRTKTLTVLLCLTGCSLVANPNDHVGGGQDASRPPDAGASDASTDGAVATDGGTWDADTGDAGSLDAGPFDAGTFDAGPFDAGPPDAGPPPECDTDSQCGPTGLARCVDHRCVFCIAPAAPITVGSSARYDEHLSMTIGTSPERHEVGLAWTGAGNDAYFFRTPVAAPVAPASMPSRGDALLVVARTEAVADILGIGLGAISYDLGSTSEFDVSVVTQDSNRSSQNYALWTDSGFDGGSYPNPLDYTDPSRLLAPLVFIDGELPAVGALAVGRRIDALGVVSVASYDPVYGNEQASFTTSELSDELFLDMPVAGRMVGVPIPGGVILWDGSADNGYKRLPTGSRTGRFSLAARIGTGEAYLLAYSAGSQIRLRSIVCPQTQVTSCAYDATFNTDLETGAASVESIALASSQGHPVLVSFERRADGRGRLVLRVLRDNGLPYDAPAGGTALVLATLSADETILDARLAVAVDGSTEHFVAAWIGGRADGTGEREVSLMSSAGACAP